MVLTWAVKPGLKCPHSDVLLCPPRCQGGLPGGWTSLSRRFWFLLTSTFCLVWGGTPTTVWRSHVWTRWGRLLSPPGCTSRHLSQVSQPLSVTVWVKRVCGNMLHTCFVKSLFSVWTLQEPESFPVQMLWSSQSFESSGVCSWILDSLTHCRWCFFLIVNSSNTSWCRAVTRGVCK